MNTLYQFGSLEIYKEYLLKDGYSQLYHNEKDFIDNDIIAFIDISNDWTVPFNTIVCHKRYGVFLVRMTTRELANALDKINGFGFAIAKALTEFFGIKHYRSFVYGYIAYMPMTGATRNNTSWIGVHHVRGFQQKDKEAYFITIQGYKLKLDFPHGDLNDRIHEVCALSEKSVRVLSDLVGAGSCRLLIPEEAGVLRKYEDCKCKMHSELVREANNLRRLFLGSKNFILRHMGIDKLGREELIKYYSQCLERIKKLY